MGPDSSESVGCIGDVNLYGHARVVFGWPELYLGVNFGKYCSISEK